MEIYSMGVGARFEGNFLSKASFYPAYKSRTSVSRIVKLLLFILHPVSESTFRKCMKCDYLLDKEQDVLTQVLMYKHGD